MLTRRSKSTSLARSLVIAAGLMAMLAAGCEKSVPTGKVKGKVLLDDAPYADAAVVFLSPTTGQAASADIGPDGTFQMKEPMQVGTYTVYLAPKSESAGAGAEEPTAVSVDQAVPDKYWNEASSDISIEIEEGENNVTVPLEK